MYILQTTHREFFDLCRASTHGMTHVVTSDLISCDEALELGLGHSPTSRRRCQPTSLGRCDRWSPYCASGSRDSKRTGRGGVPSSGDQLHAGRRRRRHGGLVSRFARAGTVLSLTISAGDTASPAGTGMPEARDFVGSAERRRRRSCRRQARPGPRGGVAMGRTSPWSLRHDRVGAMVGVTRQPSQHEGQKPSARARRGTGMRMDGGWPRWIPRVRRC